ncbi:alkaline shock response membrane anchor protein AmaP [Streptomyces sp. L2]|uniref:alkaline shock response membrane anchor protein AmaP n=1 Tax=Streptomyces sp. L2 TaxID=2162665 RepID=UPI00101239D9|nr:alkaline shock response membrane anchor protein AmaP [Streptomyces sp. L2]
MRRGTVNRVLTGITGLLLLVVGGSVLAVGLGASVPSWWPYTGSHDVLLTRAECTRWRDAGWWWPAVLGGLAVLVLLALWWLTALLRRRRQGEITVDTGDGDAARLRTRALESALAAEAGRQDGVAHAEVLLTRGRRGAPAVRAGLRLDPDAAPATALTDFTTGALAHARTSAGLPALPAEVRLSGVRHRPERVS